MPQVTLDQATAQRLQTGYALLDHLVSNPKTKKKAEALIKELAPGIQTSEDELEPHVADLKQQIRDLSDWKKKQEEAAQDREIDASFQRLADAGYTEDGITKIKELMVKRKIADPEAAAALWDRQNPAPLEASGLRPSRWGVQNLTDHVDTKGLLENPEDWADREAVRIFNEEFSRG